MTRHARGTDQIKIVAKVLLHKDGGFLPMIVVNGREHWNWRGKGYDRDVAAALAEAKEEAARYAGDWNIIIENRTTRGRRR